MFLPTLIGTVIELIRKPAERDWLVHLIMTGKAAGRPILLALLGLVLLPYDTLICLDAILRSGVRMLFTRRGLLLWQLRAYASRNARRTLVDFFAEMWIAPALALSLTWVLWQAHAVEWFFWVPVLLLWLVSPVVGWWISLPLVLPAPDLSLDARRVPAHRGPAHLALLRALRHCRGQLAGAR